MGSVQLDKVTFSSLHESFKNREKKTGSITLSGAIPAFDAKTFTQDIEIDRSQAVFEVYYERRGSYPRRLANNSPLVLDVTWGGGQVYLFVNNVSANLLRIEVYVTNSGGALAITNQIIDFTVYVFDTPFVA